MSSKRISKSLQQDVVAEFVHDHGLESCMYVYLDAFIDIHIANFPRQVRRWTSRTLYTLLENAYEDIRDDLASKGLLTNEAAGDYVLGSDRNSYRS